MIPKRTQDLFRTWLPHGYASRAEKELKGRYKRSYIRHIRHGRKRPVDAVIRNLIGQAQENKARTQDLNKTMKNA